MALEDKQVKLIHENFRRFVENKKQLTLDDVKTLAGLFKTLRGVDGALQAFDFADTLGMTDELLEVLYFGVGGRKERVIDVLVDAEKSDELDEDKAEEIAKILDVSNSRRRIMRNFMETPRSVEMASKRTDEAEPVLLVNKILDISDEKFNTSGFLGGWDGLFEATVIIGMITNPSTSKDILKRIVRLASKWNSTGKSHRPMWNIMRKLDNLAVHPNASNAPESPVTVTGEGRKNPGDYFMTASKTITPKWREWAK
jgi:hypothetical protein